VSADLEAVFATLRPILANYANHLSVKSDTATEFAVVTRSASPFSQQSTQPMYFGSLRLGKVYVSFQLMPLYMNPALNKSISPRLRNCMRSNTCFDFKTEPQPELIADLKRLTEAAFKQWDEMKWL
jgi:hypothetical protein